MALDAEVNDVLDATVASIPAMADYVAALPDGQRATALEALERHYLQTAQSLGGTEEPSRTWVASVLGCQRNVSFKAASVGQHPR